MNYIKAECHRTSILLLTGSADEKTKEISTTLFFISQSNVKSFYR